MGFLDAYVAQLPDGLASFPDHVAKASMVRVALEVRPVAADVAGLPAVLRRHVSQLPLADSWIAEAEWIAVCLAIADVHRLDAAGFYDFWYATMTRLTRGLYAAILSWVDPRTLLKQTAERWAVFHRGLEFAAAARGESMELVLRYPTALLPPVVVEEGYVAVLQALVDRSRKPEGRVRLVDVDVDATGPGRSVATFVAQGWLR